MGGSFLGAFLSFLTLGFQVQNVFSNSSLLVSNNCDAAEHFEHIEKIPKSPLESTLTTNPCPKLQPNLDALTEDELLIALTHPCRYDNLAKPDLNQVMEVSVQIEVALMEILSESEFNAHMLVQYVYLDQRLNFERLSPKRGSLLGGLLLKKQIWIPHILLRNEKDSRYKGIDGNEVFITISPKGEVVYSYRMTASFYCWMNWQKFPFDTQVCSLHWNSWAYNSTELILHWDKKLAIKVAPNLHLTEFIMTHFWTKEQNFTAPFFTGPFSGNFSELVFKFQLDRQVGYYVLEFFLPSILLVFTSWVTFWVQADVPAARVILGCNTMMAFVALTGVLNRNLPKVSYMKATEIWSFACACFIFASLMEFAFVNVIWRRRKNVEVKKPTGKHILKGAVKPAWSRPNSSASSYMNLVNSSDSLSENMSRNCPLLLINGVDPVSSQDNISVISEVSEQSKNIQTSFTTMTPQEISIWIDRKARIVFPAMFIVFNIVYWFFVYVL